MKRLLPLLAVTAAFGALAAVPRAPEGVERAAVGAYIRAHLDPIQECYNRRLSVNANLRGKLMLRLDIESDGKVLNASADGMGDPALIDCVIGRVLAWKLEPVSPDTLRVAYPIFFEPG